MEDKPREKSMGSAHSMLHVDEPGLMQRSASATTVLTAAAMEGTLPVQTDAANAQAITKNPLING